MSRIVARRPISHEGCQSHTSPSMTHHAICPFFGAELRREPWARSAALLGWLRGGRLIDGEQRLDAGVARLRLHADVAVVATDDDAIADVQTEAGAVANVLGREERFEDAPLQLGRNSGPGVADLDKDPIVFSGGPNSQRPFPIHGVDGVVDQVGPHLVQLARLGADLGEAPVVVPYDLDA